MSENDSPVCLLSRKTRGIFPPNVFSSIHARKMIKLLSFVFIQVSMTFNVLNVYVKIAFFN